MKSPVTRLKAAAFTKSLYWPYCYDENYVPALDLNDRSTGEKLQKALNLNRGELHRIVDWLITVGVFVAYQELGDVHIELNDKFYGDDRLIGPFTFTETGAIKVLINQ